MAKLITTYAAAGIQKINYKKAFAVFLLGQVAVSGAWGTPALGNAVTVVGANDPGGIQLGLGVGGSLTVNAGITLSNPAGDAITANAAQGAYTITNDGTISRGNAGTVINFTPALVGGAVHITNNNQITAFAAGSKAIDFTGSATTPTIDNSLGATITGDIVGGGGVTTLNNVGTIAGAITLGGAGDTINLNGGTVTGIINGGGGVDTINVNADFSTKANIVGVETINANAATFTINNAITGVTTGLTILAAGTVDVNNTGSVEGALGPINNSGTLNMGAGGTIGNAAAMGVFTNALNADLDINSSVANAFRVGAITNNGTISITNTAAGTVATGQLTNNKSCTINNTVASNIAINGIAANALGASLTVYSQTAATTNLGVFAANAGTLNIDGPITVGAGALANTGNIYLTHATTDLVGLTAFNHNAGNVIMGAPVTLTTATGYTVAGGATHTTSIVNGVADVLNLGNGAAKVTFNAGSNLVVNLIGNTFLTNGQNIPIVTTTAGATVNAPVNVQDYSATLQFAVAVNGNNVVLTATRTPYNTLVSGANESAVATVITNLINSGTTVSSDMKKILSYIDQLGSTAAVTQAMEELTPDANAAQGVQPSFDATSLAFNAIGNRLDMLARLGVDDLNSGYSVAGANRTKSGYAAGGMTANRHVWIKGFGASDRQNQREKSVGYNANTGGFAFGMDNQLENNSWVGLGLSYANSHVKTKESPADLTKIDSYQATLYGTYSPDKYYVDGFMAAAFNRYKGQRNIMFGPVDRQAIGKFNGLQPSAKVAAGYIHSYGNFKIIPNASIQYNYLHQQKYDETGAQDINLKNVSSKDIQKLEGGVGLKFAVFHKDQHKTITPDVHVMALYDFIRTSQETTSAFTGGGADFTVEGVKAAKTTYNIGAGLTYVHKDRLHFTFNYDLRSKKQFIGHSGSLAVKYMI